MIQSHDDVSYNTKLFSKMLILERGEALTLINEKLLWGILFILYQYHLNHGGKPDAVAQQMFETLSDEDIANLH
jgi:hypothetical protein